MTATLTRSATVGLLAEATPARRDRYVDFLRVASLAVVMLGHWLMAAVTWEDGRLRATNVLESTPGARWLTWVFQVMPVFFIVGGFSNAASLAAARRDGVGYGSWLGGRLTRLVRPVLVFAVMWTAAVAALSVAGVDPSAVRARSMAQPLWFLAVYVVVVALAPAMVAAHRRFGWRAAAALAVGVAAVDVARWPLDVPMIGWANLALVWLFAHQLGIAWRQDGAPARRGAAGLAVAGFAALAVLTTLAGYPESMVGGTGEARSNTFPPSLALVALAVAQLGLVVAARPAVDRRLARPRAWAAVVAANGMAMTVYLWHLTALVLVSVVVFPTGLMSQPETGSAAWWVLRPAWIGLLAVALVPLVVAFARVEPARSSARPTLRSARALTAAAFITVAMAILARLGFASLTTAAVAIAAMAAGWRLLSGTQKPSG